MLYNHKKLGETKAINKFEFENLCQELHSQYNKIWGYIPNIKDFLCTNNEYISALKMAIKENREVKDILPSNISTVKNLSLIESLNNDQISTKTSGAKSKALNRKDKTAVTNLEKIKNGVAVDDKLAKDNIVREVNEIRTVQSNKRLQTTRKAVIVRQNKEHSKKTVIGKIFNFISFVLVGFLGVLFGVFAGNMYVASKTLVDYNYDEQDFLPNYSAIYSQNSSKPVGNLSPTDAYIMAEWALLKESNLLDNFSVTAVGTVKAKVSGIQQQQVVSKKVSKTGNIFSNESVTDGLIPAAEIYSYNYDTNKVESYFSKDVSGNPPTAVYGKDPYKTYDINTQLADFRAEYGIKPDRVFAPIVSDKTVDKQQSLGTENGDYKFQITLNNVYSVINYVQLMVHMSGLERPPAFNELTITFTIDDNYRFKSVYVYERYQIYYLGLPADCTAETTYTFTY